MMNCGQFWQSREQVVLSNPVYEIHIRIQKLLFTGTFHRQIWRCAILPKLAIAPYWWRHLFIRITHYHRLPMNLLSRPLCGQHCNYRWSSTVTWWRHQMEKFSALLAVCEGNSPVTGEFPSQRPVTRSFDVFFDLRLNKRLIRPSRRRWFETPSRSLWRHCYEALGHLRAKWWPNSVPVFIRDWYFNTV